MVWPHRQPAQGSAERESGDRVPRLARGWRRDGSSPASPPRKQRGRSVPAARTSSWHHCKIHSYPPPPNSKPTNVKPPQRGSRPAGLQLLTSPRRSSDQPQQRTRRTPHQGCVRGSSVQAIDSGGLLRRSVLLLFISYEPTEIEHLLTPHIVDSCATRDARHRIPPSDHRHARPRPPNRRSCATPPHRPPDAPGQVTLGAPTLLHPAVSTRPPTRNIQQPLTGTLFGHNGVHIRIAGVDSAFSPPWPKQCLLALPLALPLARALAYALPLLPLTLPFPRPRPLPHIIDDVLKPTSESQGFQGQRCALPHSEPPSRQQHVPTSRQLQRPDAHKRPSAPGLQHTMEDGVHAWGKVDPVAHLCKL